MKTSDFNFDLPEELIARQPPPERGSSRLLVVNRASGQISHHQFSELEKWVEPGDLFVFNDSRVVPARFLSADGFREILRTAVMEPLLWKCLVRPGKRFKPGHTFAIGAATGTVEQICEDGERLIRFDQPVDENQHGHLALPPYMNREEEPADRERYQTVFARHEGSIAAPTAGLHFSEDLLQRLPRAFVTLHIGVGTFKPVKVETVAKHVMHEEHFTLTAETAAAVNAARRVIAVGTTAARVLEHVACHTSPPARVRAEVGSTSIFITPGFRFKAVDALLTNFHLPRSTLLMLVSALACRDLILEAYRQAVAHQYRFFSYGDAMLIV